MLPRRAGFYATLGLTELSLAGTAITDDGLIHLTALPDLKELHLQRTSVTDAGLDLLCDVRQLETLLVEETRVTTEGYERIRKKLVENSSAD